MEYDSVPISTGIFNPLHATLKPSAERTTLALLGVRCGSSVFEKSFFRAKEPLSLLSDGRLHLPNLTRAHVNIGARQSHCVTFERGLRQMSHRLFFRYQKKIGNVRLSFVQLMQVQL